MQQTFFLSSKLRILDNLCRFFSHVIFKPQPILSWRFEKRCKKCRDKKKNTFVLQSLRLFPPTLKNRLLANCFWIQLTLSGAAIALTWSSHKTMGNVNYRCRRFLSKHHQFILKQDKCHVKGNMDYVMWMLWQQASCPC